MRGRPPHIEALSSLQIITFATVPPQSSWLARRKHGKKENSGDCKSRIGKTRESQGWNCIALTWSPDTWYLAACISVHACFALRPNPFFLRAPYQECVSHQAHSRRWYHDLPRRVGPERGGQRAGSG